MAFPDAPRELSCFKSFGAYPSKNIGVAGPGNSPATCKNSPVVLCGPVLFSSDACIALSDIPNRSPNSPFKKSLVIDGSNISKISSTPSLVIPAFFLRSCMKANPAFGVLKINSGILAAPLKSLCA